MDSNAVATLKKWVMALIKDAKGEAMLCEQNEDYAGVDMYEYAVTQLESVLDVINILDEA